VSPACAANAKKQLSEVEEQLKKKKQAVKKVIEQEKSILSQIEGLNKTVKKKQEELGHYDDRISQIRANVKGLENEIASLAGKLETKRAHLKGRLRALYKHQYNTRALMLIAADDYQDLLRRSRYISLFAGEDNKLMKTFSSELKETNLKKHELESLRRDLETGKENVRRKTEELQRERDRRDQLLASVRSKRSSYEKMIKELEESSEKLREMIESLEKERPSGKVGDLGFAALKGRLPWPVYGEVLVPFGKYNDPQYNIPVFKNGIEIKAGRGGGPKAVAEGSIVYADWFKGYGLLLIINHGGGYHSLYGHLSEIFLKTGDIIKAGSAVGKIGEAALSDVPTLYFEIRHKGKPVDPVQWLKKTNHIKSR